VTSFAPLEHFDYVRLDVQCCCPICTEWRTHRDSFEKYRLLTFTHNRSCICWRCRKKRQLQQKFLGASARRELYCEMSYHAARHPKYGSQLMHWVSDELEQSELSDGWWATFGQSYTLTYWFSKFQSTFCYLASGTGTMSASGIAA
jgi:hypothetical protein